MTTLAHMIHLVLSNDIGLQHIQTGAFHLLGAALSHEEREALSGLSQMLSVAPHELDSFVRLLEDTPFWDEKGAPPAA